MPRACAVEEISTGAQVADKELIAMIKPDKPVSQMTVAERRAFANEIAALARQHPGLIEAMRRA